MKIKHERSLLNPDTGNVISKIECCAWSPNSTRLAVCTATNNQVVLFDGNSYEKKEKFALKATGKNFSRKSFVVKGLAFSPDSLRLAVGQTDCVIFVYKIGENWGDKKSIVGKYTLQSPLTCLQWHESGIFFGSADGKVKMVHISSNRMVNVMSSSSMTISLSVAGDLVVAGFLNGVVMASTVGSRDVGRQIATSTCPPFALTATHSGFVCFGGCDGRITFVNSTQSESRNNRQVVEFGSDISCASSAPSGNIIIIGSGDRVIVFSLDAQFWRQNQVIELAGAVLITGLHWSKDATKLIAGSVNGALELFLFQWKRKLIGENHEVNYIGSNQIVIKDSKANTSSVYRSNSEIKDVKIVRERYAIIWTMNTLIVGDMLLADSRPSEIDWTGMSQEGVKFCFDYDGVVLVNLVGELHLIELGNDELLTSVRTDFVNPNLMSVRINERKSGAKVLAYLLDLKTISVTDLVTSVQLCIWTHEDRIDWIELNETGKKLLFRDRSLRLFMLDIVTQESIVMLNVCGFVQWVPRSDVIVAQSRDRLYIWYDYTKPVIHEISAGSRTEATGIEREKGVTKVIFSGPSNDILLDEVLLEFDTALQDGDLARAMSFLESCDVSAESESMWRTLGNVALQKRELIIAERSFAAVGDVTRVSFIHDCTHDHSKLGLLDNDWATFEGGDFDEVVDTYIRLQKWEKAIDLAARTGRTDAKEDLERRYYDWLLDTKQEAEAGLLMERSGQTEEAIRLYIKSGRAVQAASVIIESKKMNFSTNLVQSVIQELTQAKFFEEAGQLYELPIIGDNSAALENYVKGSAFARAIDLARREFPDEVVGLEAKFGEYLLVETRDAASAISHLIEAGKTERALEAAIQAGQFERAAEISSILDNVPVQVGKQIGDYYATKDQIDLAVEMYLSSGCIREALTLLNNRGQYARAFKMAKKLMNQEEAREMYASIASGLASDGKYKEAERIYMTCEDADSAISMYKSARQYDSMIRLVKQHHPDLLTDTQTHLAKELEAEGQIHQAETYYVAAGDWKSAVQMYKNDGKWEEAYRVARSHGGGAAAKQVAYFWAKSLNDTAAAVKMLSRFGLLHQVVDYAIESGAFDFAEELACGSGEMKHKLVEVKVKRAMAFEDEGRFDEAEEMFVAAGKSKEAVLMHLHAGSFSDALRVAEEHVRDENVVSDVLVAHAKSILEKSRSSENMGRAETLLLRAGRIELAVKMYKEAKLWEDAFRVCEQYAPNLLESLRREMVSVSRGSDLDMESGYSRASSRRSSVQGREFDRMSSRTSTARRGFDDDDDDDGGDLKKALANAEKSGDREKIVKYTLMMATQLVKEKASVEALKLMSGHPGVFLVPDCRKVVMRVAMEMFSFESELKPTTSTWKNLRDALHQLSMSTSNEMDSQNVEKALLVSHYLLLKQILSELSAHNGAKELEFKLTIIMLRYTDMIRVEKAFYEAGKMAKDSDKLEMAFVFWNHFIDLIEAIEEHEVNVDHSDFVGTDIPFEVPLPSQPFFANSSTNLLEDVRSWILQISLDAHVTQTLPVCAYRDGDVYEASLINADSSQSLPCIVTGYPVIKHKMLELRPGKVAANKDDWNKLLMLTKVSGSDDLKEVLLFIGKYCGNASVARFSFQ